MRTRRLWRSWSHSKRRPRASAAPGIASPSSQCNRGCTPGATAPALSPSLASSSSAHTLAQLTAGAGKAAPASALALLSGNRPPGVAGVFEGRRVRGAEGVEPGGMDDGSGLRRGWGGRAPTCTGVRKWAFQLHMPYTAVFPITWTCRGKAAHPVPPHLPYLSCAQACVLCMLTILPPKVLSAPGLSPGCAPSPTVLIYRSKTSSV